ncbi:uncharacterized protein N7482_010361 [Penicillium canariense]|uniref:Uncharacterized protein n=1 Tax=Penicillium canariense TaxID=189055 RepID=A0A9W9HNZ7_9EURO|nr:uncharacterized protein N7482_010361 [Penicillium canariense]KAJ5151109.1 hypothetical protein N7482_010361 [Penicillium canariense]
MASTSAYMCVTQPGSLSSILLACRYLAERKHALKLLLSSTAALVGPPHDKHPTSLALIGHVGKVGGEIGKVDDECPCVPCRSSLIEWPA